MLCKGGLPVVPDTKENREWIAEHPSCINCDVGLPGRICTAQTEEGYLTFGCVKGQSRLIRPSDHFIYFRLQGCHDHVLIAGTTGYQQIISIVTHKGIHLESGQEIVHAECEKEWRGRRPGADLP